MENVMINAGIVAVALIAIFWPYQAPALRKSNAAVSSIRPYLASPYRIADKPKIHVTEQGSNRG